MIGPILIGILLIVLGIVNCRGNISTIHWYNRRKVKPEDAPKYGKLMGIASILIGASIVLMGIFEREIILIPGTATGVVLMFYAQFKYNRGLF